MSTVLLCSLMLVPVQDAQKKDVKLELPKTAPPTFALAKASQDGKSIALTLGDGSYMQPYTVQVPVTRVVKDKDGNDRTVTEMRAVTRQRRVGGRSRGRLVTKNVEQTYTVMVPVKKTRKNKDGEEEEYTAQVPEQRTRMVSVQTYVKDGKGSSGKPKPYKIADCKFTDLQGKRVDRSEVVRRLTKKSPIVVLPVRQKLDPFYKFVLKPDILLMTPPAPKPVQQPRTGGAGAIDAAVDKAREAVRDPRP